MATARAPRQDAVVDIVENDPVGAPRSSEVFLAEHEGRMVKTVDQDVRGEDGSPVTTTHSRPGTMVMYKPTERHGYIPRTVSVSSLRLLIRQGWREVCPDCGKKHIDKQGRDSTDPNLCTARDPVAVRICPVCSKRIYDNLRFSEDVDIGDDDVNVIKGDDYDHSTGETRTKASLDLHMWVRHPRQAQIMNVPALPAALREMVEAQVS